MLVESQTLEFKQLWKDDYLKTICAFANGKGGQLFIGVNDEGEITGINNCKQLLETLPNKINNKLGLLVDVIPHTKDHKKYLEINVLGTLAPVSYAGKYYKRSGSNTIELTSSNLTNFLLKKYGKTWDDISEERFSIDDIDLPTVERFKRLAQDRVPGILEEQNLESLLRKLNLNALIHRDYTDNCNLQIRVYDHKLVMYNGATLSREVPIELFDQPHQSKPFNPTMAAVFYKCGFIENWGRGTLNIIDYCTQAGLPKPEFAYSWGAVRTTFYKKAVAADQVTPQVTDEMIKLVKSINGEATRMELMQQMGLSSRANFAKLYLVPALEAGLIEMTIPDKPNSRLQKYKLTELGKAVVEKRNNE